MTKQELVKIIEDNFIDDNGHIDITGLGLLFISK